MNNFTFIDLFAGIGGFRIACKEVGGKCLFSSEINDESRRTYYRNFKELPKGDITKIKSKEIPDFDLLCAGFPCQTFSMAGKRKGFDDVRGTLIFDVARIVRDKKPKAFILENVKGLLSHEGGQTFKIIRRLFGKTFNRRNEFFLYEDNLKYNVFYKVLNSGNFGLAQNRERIFIVGFREDIKNWSKFKFPEPTDSSKVIKDILEKDVDKKYYLTDEEVKKCILWDKRNTCQYRELKKENKTHTLLTSYNKCVQGAFYLNENSKVRVFSPRECARLQGFPDNFKIYKKDKIAYKQFGNAVSPPVIKEIVKQIMNILGEE